MVSEYKGEIAYFLKKSWYHNKKEVLEDGTIKYGRVGGFKTPEEAEKSYYEMQQIFEEKMRNRITPSINKEIMIKDYLIYWFENIYSSRIESTTKMLTSYTLYKIIIPNIKYDIKLRLVTTNYLNELLEECAKCSKSAGNKARETLFFAFKDAVKDNYITVNSVIPTKQYRRTKPNITILKKEEIKKLLEATKNSNWYLEILLGLFCGLRKGEILGLKFADFNSEKNTVRIDKQLALEYELEEKEFLIKNRIFKTKDPKTENSFRTLKVPKIIVDELVKRKEKVDALKANRTDFKDNDYISCQEDGLPHHFTSLNKFLSKICARNGIPKITVHGLRHMYATILIEQGVSIAKISALLGHSSVHTTFDFYCDVMAEKEKMIAYMNNTFCVSEEEELE